MAPAMIVVAIVPAAPGIGAGVRWDEGIAIV